MFEYPMAFETEVNAPQGTRAPWQAKSAQYDLRVSIPPEFAGPGGAFSPEDLYAQALTNCFLATFKVLAENSKVTFENISVKGRLLVDRDEQKKPCMHSCHFIVQIVSSSDEGKARRLVDKAMQSGFILNSVKTSISHEIQFS
jgi:organic hydroperoxide reductase OsmC/OhrA